MSHPRPAPAALHAPRRPPGAGKTTLLKRILENTSGMRVGAGAAAPGIGLGGGLPGPPPRRPPFEARRSPAARVRCRGPQSARRSIAPTPTPTPHPHPPPPTPHPHPPPPTPTPHPHPPPPPPRSPSSSMTWPSSTSTRPSCAARAWCRPRSRWCSCRLEGVWGCAAGDAPERLGLRPHGRGPRLTRRPPSQAATGLPQAHFPAHATRPAHTSPPPLTPARRRTAASAAPCAATCFRRWRLLRRGARLTTSS
jgi:hypothetical protein